MKKLSVSDDVASTVLGIRKQLQKITAKSLPSSIDESNSYVNSVNKSNNELMGTIKKDLENVSRLMKENGLDENTPDFIKNLLVETEKKAKLTKSTVSKVNEEAVETETDKPLVSEIEKLTPEEIKAKQLKEKLVDKTIIKKLGPALKARVFGQDKTIDDIVTVLTNASLNIQINKQKPAGCYFFAGPSGVGKTELAQSMADTIGVPILKIDMGEYGLEQDITKLIGTSKGYVGYNEGGLLTNFVSENPKCIVLFDEIEKAHPSMNKILLSIMDHGTCTDNKGNQVIFKNTIIVSTSNIGAEVEYDQTLTKEEKAELRMEAIKSKLLPEIINRYDSRFDFDALSPENYKLVVQKFLTQLNKSMEEEHSFSLLYTPKLLDFIVDKSYDPAMGGRPARRFIEQIVIQNLAKNMLEDEFENIAKEAKVITLDIDKNKNIFFKAKIKSKTKVLGTLENTTELVEHLESKKFTSKKRSMRP